LPFKWCWNGLAAFPAPLKRKEAAILSNSGFLMEKETIPEIIRKAEQNYSTGTTRIGEFVDWSMHDTVERVMAYLNSKHTSGEKDSLGREKPFFNIVTAAVNIWYRATDLDRKDIKFISTTNSSILLAFIANVILQNWMNDNRFGQFLNKWGRILAQYGSAVVKFVEKGEELNASVIPWSRMIVDPIDFEALPKIEKFYKTPAQLRKIKEYDQEVVESLIKAKSSRKNIRGEQKDNVDEFIEIFEVHGELSLALLKDEPQDNDWIEYRQQMHVVSYSINKDGKYDDFTLYKGKEEKDPEMITHLIEEDGRTISIGAVESLFDVQWMQNHTIKNIKDTLDLTSKLIFQTADPNFVGRNVLSAIESGDILIHSVNNPLTQVNTYKADITALQNFSSQWKVLAQELTNTPDLTRGITQAQPLTYGLGQILNQNSNSLFEIMTENKGMHLEDMLKTYVIPHIKKKLKHKDQIVAILDSAGIQEIDAMYIPAKAINLHNERAKEMVLSGQTPPEFNQTEMENQVKQGLSMLGNKRFFKPSEADDKQWNEVFSDFEWDNIKVEIVNENTDKNAVLQTLNTLLMTIAKAPQILQDPNAKMLFNQILNETGRVSPLQFNAIPTPAPAELTPEMAVK
jgi:hypothetical protein